MSFDSEKIRVFVPGHGYMWVNKSSLVPTIPVSAPCSEPSPVLRTTIPDMDWSSPRSIPEPRRCPPKIIDFGFIPASPSSAPSMIIAYSPVKETPEIFSDMGRFKYQSIDQVKARITSMRTMHHKPKFTMLCDNCNRCLEGECAFSFNIAGTPHCDSCGILKTVDVCKKCFNAHC